MISTRYILPAPRRPLARITISRGSIPACARCRGLGRLVVRGDERERGMRIVRDDCYVDCDDCGGSGVAR